jgi:nicotinamidase-related amidase
MNNHFEIPEIESTVILLIDMQERLIGAMPESISATIANQRILLEAAKLLGVRVVVTEQYPKGLGVTADNVSALFEPAWPVLEKNTFSSLLDSAVRTELRKKSTRTVALAGIESHVCVLQTAIDSLAAGFQTILLTDAVNSRKRSDYETALRTAEIAGCVPMTVESLVFMFMRDSKHPAFRSVSKLLK